MFSEEKLFQAGQKPSKVMVKIFLLSTFYGFKYGKSALVNSLLKCS